MSGQIKGISLEIGGNTVGLQKALGNVNKETNAIQKELREVERLLKLDPKNTELLAQKQKLLGDTVNTTKDKLEALKKAKDQADKDMANGTEVNEQQFRKLQREIVSTEQDLKRLTTTTKETNTSIKGTETAVENLKKAGAGIAIAVGGAVVGLGAMANKALDNAGQLQKLSDVTGLTVERIQELQYVGTQIDLDFETLYKSQTKLTRGMAQAKEGNEAQVNSFKRLGIQITGTDGKLRDSKVVLLETVDALSKVKNETERDALSLAIFGKSAMELNPLIKLGKKELEALSEEARKNGGIMSTEAVKGLDDFGDKLEGMKQLIMGAFGESLAQLMPKIQELIAKIDIEKIKNGIKEFADKTVELLTFILENGNTIMALVVGIGAGFVGWNVAGMINLVTESIKAYQKANEGATVAQWALNIAKMADPTYLIIAAVMALVGATIYLWNTNEGFRNAIIGMWNAIKEATMNVWNVIVKFFTVDIPNAWNNTIKFFQELPGKIMQFISELPGKIGYALGLIIGTLAKWLVEAITWVATDLPKFIIEFVKWYISIPFKVFEILKQVIAKLGEWLTLAINWAKENVPKIVTNIVTFFKELPEKIEQVGKDLITGLWNGISSMITWVSDRAKEFSQGLISGFKKAWGIASPSKVMAELGRNLMQGLLVGIDTEKDTPVTLLKLVTDNIKNYLQTALTDIGLFTERDNLLYELWGITTGKNATETEKLDKQIENLTGQQENQKTVVESVETAYKKMVEMYGATSAESIRLENQLLKEKIAYEKLGQEIAKVNEQRMAVSNPQPNRSYFRQGWEIAQSLKQFGYSDDEVNAYAEQYNNAGGKAFKYNKPTVVNNYNISTIGDTTAEFIQKTRQEDKSKSMLGGAVFA